MRAEMSLPAAIRPLAEDAKPRLPDRLSALPRARVTVPEAAARSLVSALLKVYVVPPTAKVRLAPERLSSVV